MAKKKIDIAISHALSISLGKSKPLPTTIPHATMDPADAESNPLNMLTAGPNQVFTVKHGVLVMDLKEVQKVSRVEIRRDPNGDLIITLHE